EGGSEYAFIAAPPPSAAEGVGVTQRRREAGQQFVRSGAGLDFPADRSRPRRPCLVWLPRLEQLMAAEREPQMRAAEFVWRAEEEGDPERLHVGGLVGGVMGRVAPAERARGGGEVALAHVAGDR